MKKSNFLFSIKELIVLVFVLSCIISCENSFMDDITYINKSTYTVTFINSNNDTVTLAPNESYSCRGYNNPSAKLINDVPVDIHAKFTSVEFSDMPVYTLNIKNNSDCELHITFGTKKYFYELNLQSGETNTLDVYKYSILSVDCNSLFEDNHTFSIRKDDLNIYIQLN